MRPSEAAAGQMEAQLAEMISGGTGSAPSDGLSHLSLRREAASTLRLHARIKVGSLAERLIESTSRR